MKRVAVRIFIALSLLGMSAVSPIYGQSADRLIADIPFSFVVGDRVLPAGQYTVRRSSRGLLLIRKADGAAGTFALTFDTQASTIQEEAKLVFKRVGDEYVLFRVWAPGSRIGQQLLPSRLEPELAQGSQPQRASLRTIQGRH